MDFYDVAKGSFRRLDYERPHIESYPKFKEFYKDLVFNNKKALIYGDYDPDGMFSVLILKEAFHSLKFTNFDIVPYTNRTHSLDENAVRIALDGSYDYMIICDTGSANHKEIKMLSDTGLRVIVIDHHQTPYEEGVFNDNVVYINSTVENRNREDKLVVSAAALTYILVDKFFTDCRVDSTVMAPYALASMYSDSIDMSSRFARGLYTKATSLDSVQLPVEIFGFLNQYKRFTRRFIEFDMIPKINAAFRSEKFNDINKVYMCKDRAITSDCIELVNTLAELHNSSANMVKFVSDIVYTEELNNFVIGNLDSVNTELDIEENKLYNYTGLVANSLATKYKKASIVLCTSSESVKGSFRDHLGRDYLKRFKSICSAGGHGAAFGFWVDLFDVADFIDRVRIIDKHFSIEKASNEPLIFDITRLPDSIYLSDIAKYNEFAGQINPIALLRVSRRADMPVNIDKYNQYVYRWGDQYIVGDKCVNVGDTMLIKPTLTKNVKLYLV